VCVQLAIDISNFFILRKKRALAGWAVNSSGSINPTATEKKLFKKKQTTLLHQAAPNHDGLIRLNKFVSRITEDLCNLFYYYYKHSHMIHSYNTWCDIDPEFKHHLTTIVFMIGTLEHEVLRWKWEPAGRNRVGATYVGRCVTAASFVGRCTEPASPRTYHACSRVFGTVC
jgi:hypothetical protein